jgi:hypothetical protein
LQSATGIDLLVHVRFDSLDRNLGAYNITIDERRQIVGLQLTIAQPRHPSHEVVIVVCQSNLSPTPISTSITQASQDTAISQEGERQGFHAPRAFPISASLGRDSPSTHSEPSRPWTITAQIRPQPPLNALTNPDPDSGGRSHSVAATSPPAPDPRTQIDRLQPFPIFPSIFAPSFHLVQSLAKAKGLIRHLKVSKSPITI